MILGTLIRVWKYLVELEVERLSERVLRESKGDE